MNLNPLKSFFVLGIALMAMTVSVPAFASAYEWLSNYTLSYSGEGGAQKSNTKYKVYYDVNTSGPYTEYRSVYYYVTTTGYHLPGEWAWSPPTSTWTGWIEYDPICRKSGVVNGTIKAEFCNPTSTTVIATSTLWTRVTTNYSGCGTWTPNPDLVNCGDQKTASTTITP